MASNANIYTTGYDVQVVDSYPPLLNCGICTLILRDAMHGCVNHVFCKSCITKHIQCGIKIDGNVMCPGGCNIVINPAKLEPSKVVDRMVSTLYTRCSNGNCSWQGDLLDLVQEAHDVECLNEQVKCIYYDIGCKKELYRKDIHLHEQTSHKEHTRLIYQNLTNSNNQIKNLKEENVALTKENVALKQENIARKQEIAVLKQEYATLTKKFEEVDILKDVQTSTNKYKQVQTSTNKYKQQVQNNTAGFQVLKKETSKLENKNTVAANEVVLMKSKEKMKKIDNLKLKLTMNSSYYRRVSLVNDDKVVIIKSFSDHIEFHFNVEFSKCYQNNNFHELFDKFHLINHKDIMMDLINTIPNHLYDYNHYNNQHYMFVFPLDLRHIKNTEVLVPDIFKLTIVDNEIMVERLNKRIHNPCLMIEKYDMTTGFEQKLNLKQLLQLDKCGVHSTQYAKGYAFLRLHYSTL